MSKKYTEAVFTLDFENEPLFEGIDLLRMMWQQNGYAMSLDKGKVIIYAPQLAKVIMTKEIKAWNREAEEDEIIDGTEFRIPYIDGFKKGIQFFERNFKIDTSVLYGNHAEQYIRTLHKHFFHSGKSKLTGWDFVKHQYPMIIDSKIVYEYGYYAGIAYQVDELKRLQFYLFEKYKFDTCIENGEYAESAAEAENRKSNTELEPIYSLESIFKDEAVIEQCVGVLREVDPPLIGKEMNVLKVPKGAFCVWVAELLYQSFIKKVGDHEMTAILNHVFDGLELSKDGSMIRKDHKRAEQRYRHQFKLFLSQVSH